jgi:hypothetical protein
VKNEVTIHVPGDVILLKPAWIKALEVLQKKCPAGCGLPGCYKGWVSKHNPYTILKRFFPTKKIISKIFSGRHGVIDTLSTHFVAWWNAICLWIALR